MSVTQETRQETFFSPYNIPNGCFLWWLSLFQIVFQGQALPPGGDSAIFNMQLVETLGIGILLIDGKDMEDVGGVVMDWT